MDHCLAWFNSPFFPFQALDEEGMVITFERRLGKRATSAADWWRRQRAEQRPDLSARPASSSDWSAQPVAQPDWSGPAASSPDWSSRGVAEASYRSNRSVQGYDWSAGTSRRIKRRLPSQSERIFERFDYKKAAVDQPRESLSVFVQVSS